MELNTDDLMAFSPDRIKSGPSYDKGNVQFILLTAPQQGKK